MYLQFELAVVKRFQARREVLGRLEQVQAQIGVELGVRVGLGLGVG